MTDFADRGYPWNVSVITLTDSNPTSYQYGPIWENCKLDTPNEDVEVWAATDRTNLGVPYAQQHARTWTLQLGAFVANPAASPAMTTAKFGWNLSALTVGPQGSQTDILAYYTVARINARFTLVEARATMDAVTAWTVNGVVNGNGWRFPVIQKHAYTIDLEATITGDPPLAGLALSRYRSPCSFAIDGGGISLAVTSGALFQTGGTDETTDTSTDKATLKFIGLPTITPATGFENSFLARALAGLPLDLVMTRHGGGVQKGRALFTEASFESPMGAIKQGATLTGYGPLSHASS